MQFLFPVISIGSVITGLTQGSLLVGGASGVLAQIADVPVGQVLASGGVGVVPAWTAGPTFLTWDSLIADGAAAVAHVIDTRNTFANATSKLVSIRNNTVEKSFFDLNGSWNFNQNIDTAGVNGIKSNTRLGINATTEIRLTSSLLSFYTGLISQNQNLSWDCGFSSWRVSNGSGSSLAFIKLPFDVINSIDMQSYTGGNSAVTRSGLRLKHTSDDITTIAENNVINAIGTDNRPALAGDFIGINVDVSLGTNGSSIRKAMKLKGGAIQIEEIATPASSPANTLQLYAKDVAGVTLLAYLDSAGVEHVL